MSSGLLRRCIYLLLLISSANAADFFVPPDTPVIPWLRFSVQYAVRVMGGETPTGVYFYVTNDGGASWTLLGEDPDKQSPMLVNVPGEGTYGFISVITTRNRQPLAPRPGTRPEKFVIVDRTPPTVRWLSPNPATGEVIAGGAEGITLQWESSDPHFGATPVNIDYSTDGALWLPVRGGLPPVGIYTWNPPALPVDEVQLRLIAQDLAGNQRSVRSRAKIQFDRLPPQVVITGPDAAGKSEFDISFNATDESGVASMELYYSNDNGATWALYGPIFSSPAHFSTYLTGNSVGLYITATDRKGNRIPTPQPGASPMRNVILNLQKPQVAILPPFDAPNAYIDANSPASISWNTMEAYPRDNAAILEYSLDGGQTWYFIADGQPTSGSYNGWIPRMEARGALLRVTVVNRFDNRGSAVSQFFNISANRPDTNITNVVPFNVSGTSTPATPASLPPAVGAEILTPGDENMFSSEDIAGMMRVPGSRPATTTPPTPARSSQISQPTPSTPANNQSTSGNDDLVIPMPSTGQVSDTTNFGDADIPLPPAVGLGATPSANDGVPPTQPASNRPSQSIEDILGDTPVSDQISPVDDNNPFAALDNSIPSLDNSVIGDDNSDPFSSLDSSIPALDSSTSDFGSTDDNTIIAQAPATPARPATGSPATSATAPAGLEALLRQAQAMVERGDLGQAENLANQLLSASPNNASALAVMAQVRTNQGRFSEAIDFAGRANQIAPKDLNYLEVLSYAKYAEANRLQSALRSGGVAAGNQQPVSAEIIRLLNDAETAYQQLTMSADRTQEKGAYFRLGQIEYFRGTKILTDDNQSSESIRKAIDYYQKAREIGEPDYREILQIGICNYRLRDYEHAETFLEMAIETATNDRVAPKEAYYYLASIHEKLGRPQQALEFWEKVVQNYPPDNQYHKAAVKRIEELKNGG